MKKLLGIIVLGLLWCNVGFADVAKDALTYIKETEDLLKGNYKCEDIIEKTEWTFSFSKISNKNYYVEATNNSIGKLFGELETYNKLWWYQLVESEMFLILNVLELRPKKYYNYMSILIFFNADYTKEDFSKLVEAYNKSEQAFYNQADNFVKTKLELGKESHDKGNWMNLMRALCESDYKPELKLPKLDIEKLKNYKPTELAPGVKRKTNN